MVILNIGLHVKGGALLPHKRVIEATMEVGGKVLCYEERHSASEPTLILGLEYALSDEDAFLLAVVLQQEAIAQQEEDGHGKLHGPLADEWGPFNPDFFLTFEE